MGGGKIVEVVRTASASQRDTFMVAINQEFEKEGWGVEGAWSTLNSRMAGRSPRLILELLSSVTRDVVDGCSHY